MNAPFRRQDQTRWAACAFSELGKIDGVHLVAAGRIHDALGNDGAVLAHQLGDAPAVGQPESQQPLGLHRIQLADARVATAPVAMLAGIQMVLTGIVADLINTSRATIESMSYRLYRMESDIKELSD